MELDSKLEAVKQQHIKAKLEELKARREELELEIMMINNAIKQTEEEAKNVPVDNSIWPPRVVCYDLSNQKIFALDLCSGGVFREDHSSRVVVFCFLAC